MAKKGSKKRKIDDVNPNFVNPKASKQTSDNTPSYFQILDIQDGCPSVFLFFEKLRIIFNAGEGLQRYCTEQKIKLSQIDYIFLSRVCSETAGGLPGLLLTLHATHAKEHTKETSQAEKQTKQTVNMRGPSGFNYLINAMKEFVPSDAMVLAQSFGPDPQIDGIDVSDPKKFSEPHCLIDNEVVKLSAILLHPNKNNGLGIVAQPADISVIYVCELPRILGKFHREKADALGLVPPRDYKKVQNAPYHSSVKIEELGITVHPGDVMDPPIPGPIVLLVDCPTTSHLETLLCVETLNVFYADHPDRTSENAKAVSCVIHLSPASVSSSLDYQTWMKRFGNVQHIMAGHDNKKAEIPVLQSSARLSARLNYLCPRVFPASGFLSPHVENSKNNSLHSCSVNKGSLAVESAENLLKFNLRPHATLGLDKSSIPDATGPANIVAKLQEEIPEIVAAVQQVKQLWDNPSEVMTAESLEDMLPGCLKNVTREVMEIVFLGTGSSQPSKYRNVSSIFINLFLKGTNSCESSNGGLLLDCGEGTLGQLKRHFGKDADEVVRRLRCIWISHIHADHFTGIVRILAVRRDLLKDNPQDPLLVVGPGILKPILDAYMKLEDLDLQFLDCECTTRAWNPYEKLISNPDDVKTLNRFKTVLREAGIEALVSFPVDHSPNIQAFGVSIKAAKRSNNVDKMIPGWKIVYSGDTRPCLELVEEAQDATVLIHEATFEDGMAKEAENKHHSTTKEAIKVAEAANVYRLIMTHFSQRYPKIPSLEESHMHNACIAFDLMSINLADLPILPQVLPHLKLLFRNEMDDEVVEDVL